MNFNANIKEQDLTHKVNVVIVALCELKNAKVLIHNALSGGAEVIKNTEV